jgi:hypothetical protein
MGDQDNQPAPATPSPQFASARVDIFAGAALGALLGLLMGFSTSPVASTVVTGLVALLAGLFGLSEKLAQTFSTGAARRLAAFGFAAVLVIPAAVWVRAHEILGPSVEEQKQLLVAMGIGDAAEQKNMLLYMRFGFLPSGTTAPAKDAPPIAGGNPFLYADSTNFCDRLTGLKAARAPMADFENLYATWGDHLAKIGKALSALPAEKKAAAFEAAPLYLCTK